MPYQSPASLSHSSGGSRASSVSYKKSRRPSQTAIAESLSSLMYANAVYYSSWRCYRGETPATLNFGCISHVLYAFLHLDKDGSVFFADEWGDLQAPVDGLASGGCVASLLAQRQYHPHVKLILSIGGGGQSQHFAAVASRASTRDQFGKSVRSLLDASGFDGVDNPTQGRDFLSLLATLRLHLPDKQYLVSAALPAGKWALQLIDLYKARHYLDCLHLMAYDFAGPWSRRAGHHAQLHAATREEQSGSAAVDYVRSTGFPPAKILLGIPCYGRSFLSAAKAGQKFIGGAGEDGTFDYKALPRPGTDEVVSGSLAVASCTGDEAGFVSYDNPDTVKIKAQYCKRKKLGGLFYWHGTGDVAYGSRSLIATGFKTLHS